MTAHNTTASPDRFVIAQVESGRWVVEKFTYQPDGSWPGTWHLTEMAGFASREEAEAFLRGCQSVGSALGDEQQVAAVRKRDFGANAAVSDSDQLLQTAKKAKDAVALAERAREQEQDRCAAIVRCELDFVEQESEDNNDLAQVVAMNARVPVLLAVLNAIAPSDERDNSV